MSVMMSFIMLILILASVCDVYSTTMLGSPAIGNTVPAYVEFVQESNVIDDPYDFIILGGGLAGCVLANRLSANPSKRVLMLEAGSPNYNNLYIRMPAGIFRLFRSVYDWEHETFGEKACNGRKIYLQRGKVLGGSSCTNLGLFFRGSAEDYTQWGVPGWTANDVLTYFKASQNDKTGRDSDYHGKSGLWIMDEVRYQNPLSKRFLKVGEAAGFYINDDFNNWSIPQLGFGRFTVSQKYGERVSGASAFLTPALHRKNLTVRTGVMVRKVDFDSSNTACGVTYDLIGDDSLVTYQTKLKDRGEVVLACGAIGSPQILMCSGIGPSKHLQSHGIDVVYDNPYVGENLQDHPAAVVSFKTPTKGVSISSKLRFMGMTNPWPVVQWLIFKSGVISSSGCDHGAFLKTSPLLDQADLQVRFVPALSLGPDGMAAYTKWRTTKTHPDGYTFQSIACRAKSKGRIRLASSNTHVKPIIFGGYMSHPADLATLREGIKFTRALGRRPEWAEYLGEEVYPGPAVETDSEIDEYIKNYVHTSNALTGTCKMGTQKDCVVGPDLKVIGVNGLRVADSSVIPIILGGQIGTPVVMIAERAAEFMLKSSINNQVEIFQIIKKGDVKTPIKT